MPSESDEIDIVNVLDRMSRHIDELRTSLSQTVWLTDESTLPLMAIARTASPRIRHSHVCAASKRCDLPRVTSEATQRVKRKRVIWF